MRPTSFWSVLADVLLASWVVANGAHALEPIPVRIEVRDDWETLPSTPDDPQSEDPVITHAAVRIPRIIAPDTGEPYTTEWPFDCEPDQIHHRFLLEKREFLLGEPIVVEYRVTVEGPGEYAESAGGNYRSRGRDDNFLFLMRHEDGTWVRGVEPYSGLPGGGIGGDRAVKAEEALSLWFAVQRWCAIEKPGRYDLYCFYAEIPGAHQAKTTEEVYRDQIPETVLRTHTVDERGNLFPIGSTGKSEEYVVERMWYQPENTPSPLATQMPAELKTLLEDFTIPTPNERIRRFAEQEVRDHVQGAVAFAHFPVVIERGTLDEQQAMIRTWAQRGKAAWANARAHSDPRGEAVLDGIYFSMPPSFLHTIRDWTEADPASLWGFNRSIGLGVSPHPAATAILLEFPRDGKFHDIGSLRLDWYPGVMANFIELLSHENAGVRNGALHMLRKHAGGYFFADSAGCPLETLTDKQMEEARNLWTAWWTKHREDFHSFGNGIWGYIDTNGAFVIAPSYAWASPFQAGAAPVSLRGGAFEDDTDRFYIDQTGTRLARPYTRYPDTRLRPVQIDGLWGYEDSDGERVIPTRFEGAGRFTDGLATVKLGGKIGYIDERGKITIPPTFDNGYAFAEGQAVVQVKGRYGVIDKRGEFILEPKYASVGRIIEGRAQFREGGKFGFLDESGHVVVEPQFMRVGDFQGGLARVEVFTQETRPDGPPLKRKHVGYINRWSEYVIRPEYLESQPFAGNLAAVKIEVGKQHLWGYIDRTGEMVIPPQFSQARSFSEGFAAVRSPDEHGGKWGFIDPSGAIVIPPQFDSADNFSGGLAAVRVESPYFHFKAED